MAETASKNESKSVAKRHAAMVAIPDYIKQNDNRGNEDVQINDIVIPRLEVVQAMSPCLKKSDAAYIDGIQQGDMYNSVTRINYGDTVVLTPVLFRKEYLVWKDRLKGGGFRGAFPTLEAANARIAQTKDEGEDPKEFMANETAQNFCLMLGDEGIEEIVISMSRTKLKVSRHWNALIRINGSARFSRCYTIATIDDHNDKGEFKNYGVTTLGFSPKEVYERAEALYENVKAGAVRMSADTSDDGPIEVDLTDKSEY